MAKKKDFLGVKLTIEVRDKEGKLIKKICKESDLILENFRDLIAEVLYPYVTVAVNSWRTAALIDTGGTARSVAVFSTANTADTGDGGNFLMKRYWDTDFGVRIAIGTSTVSPTRADYKLGAEVARGIPTQTIGADYISWAISITLTTAQDIAEAGLMLYCIVAGYTVTPTLADILMFRDTFTPVSVPAGGTISITYTLTL